MNSSGTIPSYVDSDATYVEDLDYFRNIPDSQYDKIKVICMNIRSCTRNLDQFLCLLTDIGTEMDVIILVEAFIQEHTHIQELTNYHAHKVLGKTNKNDGIVVYIKNDINLISLKMDTELTKASAVQVIVESKGNYKLKITACYRSPVQNNEILEGFIDDLQDLIKNYDTTDSLLMGDLNINIIAKQIGLKTEKYLDMLSSCGYDCLNHLATREKACLDHCFYRGFNRHSVQVIKTAITDHFPVICQISTGKMAVDDSDLDQNGFQTKFNTDIFKQKIKELNWDTFYLERDVDIATNILTEILETCKTQASVRIESKSNKKKILKPWITPSILRSIRKRDRMFTKTIKQPLNKDLQTAYKQYKNTLNQLTKNVKENYYLDQLELNKGNMRKKWQIINEAANRTNKEKRSFPIKDWLNEKENVKNEKDAANVLNNYFSTIGSVLASTIPESDLHEDLKTAGYLEPPRSIFIYRVEPEEVMKITQTMRGGSAPGPDGLSPQAIKEIIGDIKLPLTHLFNMSISEGIFPRKFKNAKVVPLFKKGAKTDPANYRPISLINVIAKIYEKLLKHRLMSFLEENNIISRQQFGFQNKISTQDALFQVTEEMYGRLDKGEKVILTCLDVSKAFDCISKRTLIDKLEKCGIRGLSLKLLRSYISDREQAVHIGDMKSDESTIKDFGCSQGTSIGPLLFLIYVNNLAEQEYKGKIFMFADDVALVSTGKTWREAHDSAEEDLRTIGRWMNANSLTVNASKSAFMNISRKHDAKSSLEEPLVYHTCEGALCNCPSLKQVESMIYLGITFDHRLNWEHHINNLCQKLRKCAYVLYGIKYFSGKLVKNIYQALFESVLQYGILIWGGAFKHLINKVFRIQKITLKVLFGKPRRYATETLFKELKLATIHQLYSKNMLNFIGKEKDIFFTDVRKRKSEAYRLKLPKVHHKYAQMTTKYRGMLMINRDFDQIIALLNIKIKNKQKKEIHNFIMNKPFEYFAEV